VLATVGGFERAPRSGERLHDECDPPPDDVLGLTAEDVDPVACREQSARESASNWRIGPGVTSSSSSIVDTDGLPSSEVATDIAARRRSSMILSRSLAPWSSIVARSP